MTEREKVAARIRALRAKTVANGCTEDEAMAAAAMAAQLLADYNLTLDEVEMRASPFSRHRERHEDAVGERLWKPAAAISELTGARYWMSAVGVWPVEITFFGFAHEVDVASYLLEICTRAMRTEQRRLDREWGLLTASARAMKVRPFLDGMADRLRQRLLALKPPAPTGTGLIVLRGELIDLALAAEGIQLGARAARSSLTDDAAYGAGRRAADGVALNSGLGGGRPPVGRLADQAGQR